jgi:hypothetical protein
LRLQVHLEGVLAEEELRATGGAGLTIDGYYDLVLAATGDPREAERRARARRSDLLRRGLTPE